MALFPLMDRIAQGVHGGPTPIQSTIFAELIVTTGGGTTPPMGRNSSGVRTVES